MRTFTFVIQNTGGLASGQAAIICQEAEQYESRINIEMDNKILSAKSLLGLIAMQARYGDTIRFTISGKDEIAAEIGLLRVVRQELG